MYSPGDRLYVLTGVNDPTTPRVATQIVAYTLNGAYLGTWRIRLPDDPREYVVISHIEVDTQGYVYASDVVSFTVWKFDPQTGQPLARIEPGGRGAGPGQFDHLYGLGETFSVAANGDIYTVEGYPNGRVQVFRQVVSNYRLYFPYLSRIIL